MANAIVDTQTQCNQVYAKNKHGELEVPAFCPITDTFQPDKKPEMLQLDGRKVSIKHPKSPTHSSMAHVGQVALSWGKADCSKDANIVDIPFTEERSWGDGFEIPQGLSHPPDTFTSRWIHGLSKIYQNSK